jgi:hypothetical protein
MRIVNADGSWVKNVCRLPMADPTQNVLFQPNELVCAAATPWLAMQIEAGLFERAPNPLSPLNTARPARLK